MSELDIIRAWKDKTYRNSLSADELAQMPEHPAGAIELTSEELANVDGGLTYGCTPATPYVSAASIVSVVSVVVSIASAVSLYVSYQYGTGGTAVNCCPAN